MISFSIRFSMSTTIFGLILFGCVKIALCEDSQSDTLVAKTATEARPDLSVLLLESNVFSKNLSRLAEFVTAAKNAGKNVNKVP